MHSKLSRVALSAFVVASGFAQADVLVFTDRASFLAATQQAGTDSFDDLVIGATIATNSVGQGFTPLLRTIGSFGYGIAGSYRNLNVRGVSPDSWISDAGGPPGENSLRFGQFSGGAAALGGEFFVLDGTPVTGPGAAMRMTVVDASGAAFQFAFETRIPFIGFVSNGPALQQVTVWAADPSVGRTTVNNLTLAVAVPEAPSGAMWLIGIAALAVNARWRVLRARDA